MLVRHSIIYFIGRVAPAIISIIGVMIYTRIVSPEVYGIYSLITVITGLINILFFQWIRSSFIRYYNSRDKIDSFFGTLIRSHLIVLLILLIIFSTTLIFFFILGKNFWFVAISYLLMALLSTSEFFVIYYRTILKPSLISKVNILKSIIVIFLSTVMIYLGLGIYGLLFGSLLGSIFGIAVYFKNVKFKRNKTLSINIDKKTVIKFLKYGLPITLSFVLSVAMQNIDKIMISIMLGFEENGNYAVSYDLFHNIIYMIMMSISLAGFPIVLKTIEEKGILSGKREFINYTNLLLFVSIPACVGLASISIEFNGIIIGNRYSIPEGLFIIIIIASFFHGIKSYYFDLILQISVKTKYFFIPALVAMIVNIILNAFMLNIYGIEGAAYATAISFFIAMVISGIYGRRSLTVPFPYLSLLKIITASLIMFTVINMITLQNQFLLLFVKVILGAFIYIFLAYLFNTMNIRVKLNKKRGAK